MPTYNFKGIGVVPSAKDFIDIILSKTQRKTPTVIRKGFKIQRIRSFYMRKVKFTQQNYDDKLTQILEQFPRLDDIHPFYGDLIHVLYSKDHYKLALAQVNTAKRLIDNIGKDSIKFIKMGDSLYRCKALKRAALGRMCTVTKRLASSLTYLEQVRQHLSRLPSIDPSSRTLIITGYPNVGKSSFINKVSRANVDVQPYPFTTKSLFVGHMDYNYVPWQIIDTPGILDHPLEERNTIEMLAITAIAHLHATVMFFIDISETCGHTIKQQISLYNSIKPLFANKPLLLVATKIDLKPLDSIEDEDRELLETIVKERNTELVSLSNLNDEGIGAVKKAACDMLLAVRYERKMKSKRINEILTRVTVVKPQPRDEKQRGPSIPESVREEKKALKAGSVKQKRRTEKDLEVENGGPGVYSMEYRKLYQLENPEWRYDIVPEIIDGHNISDFMDPEIESKLAALEIEEEQLLEQWEKEMSEIPEAKEEPVTHRKPPSKGDKVSASVLRARSKSRNSRKRETEEGDDKEREVKKIRTASRSRSKSLVGARSTSRPAAERSRSIGSRPLQKKADKLGKNALKKIRRDARSGEGDHRILNEMPKHLFSGKRTIGKTDRR